MYPTWQAQIMWSQRADFGGTYDDVTIDTKEARWRVGFSQAWARMARPGQLRLRLDNSFSNVAGELGFYSPDTSGALAGMVLPFVPVRLRVTFNAVTYTKFSGFILSYHVNPDRSTVDIMAVDALGALAFTAFSLGLQTNISEEDLIALILDEMPAGFATMGYWWLGHIIRSVLGATTLLGDGDLGRDLDTGKTTFDFAGETWRSDITTGYEAIEEIVRTTWGRFYCDTSGNYVFHNRTWEFLNTSVAASFASKALNLMGRNSVEDIANRVKVVFSPRKLGSAGTTVMSLTDTPAIEAGQSITLTMRFRDPVTGEAIGAASVTTPSYTANSAENGSGTNMTADVSLVVDETKATEMAVTITNNHPTAIAYIIALSATGTPLYTYDDVQVTSEDIDSQAQYGRRDKVITLPMDADTEFAKTLADYHIANWAQPQTLLEDVEFAYAEDSNYDDLLALGVMSRINFSEPESNVDNEFWIIQEEHEVGEGLGHSMRFLLEKADVTGYWMLGVSLLGDRTQLSPFN